MSPHPNQPLVQREVPFDFTGFKKPRLLRYEVNSLSDLEAELGMSPREIFRTRTGILTTRALLWAGLKHEDRSLTPERVGTFLTAYLRSGGTLEDVMVPVAQAIKLSGLFPEAEEDEDGESPNGDADGDGKHSDGADGNRDEPEA